MTKKILITGGAGFLGTTWAMKNADRYEVHVTLNHQRPNIQNIRSHWVDLTDSVKVHELIEHLQPDIVINTAGLTNVDDCEAQSELAYQLNVKTVQHVAEACAQLKTKLVHISTDHLFSGDASLYTEVSPVNPINEYAKTKYQAELVVQKIIPSALVIRTNFYGPSHSKKKSFTDWLQIELSQYHELKMYTDLYFSPIYIGDLIHFTNIAIEKKLAGVINITGSERISKFDFGIAYAKVFNLNQSLIHPTTLAEFPKRVVRPKDMSLSCEKFYQLTGLRTGTVLESLEKMKKEIG